MARKNDPTQSEPQHSHSYQCYSVTITCGQTVAHTHSDACFDGLTCGLTAHTHTNACLTETLICGK
ncbi:hypothetical protein DSM104299_00241 [Baekduia alba]|nr:hypothetical protein DSM104299_00241 [Baekduia alba]